jgi:molecular chaperone DnaJ
MADPYSILEINPGASDEELTKAYRRLAKKYHPDINPGNKTAEQKMREVNAAYDEIKKQRSGGANYQQADSSYGRQSQNFEMNQVRIFVENRRYRDALFVLSQLPNHTGEWFFYSAIANAGTGNRATALSHAGEAVRMEPGNIQFRQLLDQLERSSFAYRQAGEGRGFRMQNLGRSIFSIILAQVFCLCCCRIC